MTYMMGHNVVYLYNQTLVSGRGGKEDPDVTVKGYGGLAAVDNGDILQITAGAIDHGERTYLAVRIFNETKNADVLNETAVTAKIAKPAQQYIRFFSNEEGFELMGINGSLVPAAPEYTPVNIEYLCDAGQIIYRNSTNVSQTGGVQPKIVDPNDWFGANFPIAKTTEVVKFRFTYDTAAPSFRVSLRSKEASHYLRLDDYQASITVNGSVFLYNRTLPGQPDGAESSAYRCRNSGRRGLCRGVRIFDV